MHFQRVQRFRGKRAPSVQRTRVNTIVLGTIANEFSKWESGETAPGGEKREREGRGSHIKIRHYPEGDGDTSKSAL